MPVANMKKLPSVDAFELNTVAGVNGILAITKGRHFCCGGFGRVIQLSAGCRDIYSKEIFYL